jgi:hypothetical protein
MAMALVDDPLYLGQVQTVTAAAVELGKMIHCRLDFPTKTHLASVDFLITAAQASGLMQLFQAYHSRYDWPSVEIPPSAVDS